MNLFIGNLNPDTNVNNLRPLFTEFGEVVSAKIIYDNATGMSRCFGFVEMADKFHAMDAIDNLDCTYFEGNIISVKEAKANNSKGGPAGNRSFKPRTPRPRTGGDYNNNRGEVNANRIDYNSRGDFNNNRY